MRLAAGLLLVVGVALALTLSGGNSRHRTLSPGRPAVPRAVPPARVRPPAAVAPARRSNFRVATLSLTLNEPASAAIATGRSAAGAPVRVLPTRVRYPVSAGGGAFPLVVFSQGFDEPAEAYSGLLDAWARAGYVVADPTYPLTDPSSPAGVNENDIVNHPADLRYVISALTGMAGAAGSPLHGVLDPSRVAVVGQSDGGDVSLAVAANSCCLDSTVRAAIILSGAELTTFGGTYFSGGSVPLLVSQASDDTINPPGCSAQIFNQAPQPKYYLDIDSSPPASPSSSNSWIQHLAPYTTPGPVQAGIARVTIAFLNAYLKGGPTGLSGLTAAAKLPGGETLSGGTSVPAPASSSCPGAP